MKELQLFAGIVCAIYAVLCLDYLWREARFGPEDTDEGSSFVATVILWSLPVSTAAAIGTIAILLIRAGLS